MIPSCRKSHECLKKAEALTTYNLFDQTCDSIFFLSKFDQTNVSFYHTFAFCRTLGIIVDPYKSREAQITDFIDLANPNPLPQIGEVGLEANLL